MAAKTLQLNRNSVLVTCAFIFFLLGTCNVALAQIDFRPGFVIDTNGDSLKGEISYKDNATFWSSCTFRTSETGAPIVYKPEAIREYGFLGGRHFRSVKLKNANDEIVNLFAEVLVDGKCVLFYYKGDFYVSKEGGRLVMLENKQTTLQRGSSYYTQYSNQYKGVLTYLLSDCEEVKGDVPKTKFEEESLMALLAKYNSCGNSQEVVITNREPAVKRSFGIVAGYRFGSLVFSKEQSAETTGTFTGSHFIGGLSMNVMFPRRTKRTSLQMEFCFSRASYTGTSQEADGTRVEVTHEISQIVIPILARYEFSKRFVQPYINAGGLLKIKTSSSTRKRPELNGLPGGPSPADNLFNPPQYGIQLGGGVQRAVKEKANIFLDLRVELSRLLPAANKGAAKPNFVLVGFTTGVRF